MPKELVQLSSEIHTAGLGLQPQYVRLVALPSCRNFISSFRKFVISLPGKVPCPLRLPQMPSQNQIDARKFQQAFRRIHQLTAWFKK
jgi:hypothetical protein